MKKNLLSSISMIVWVVASACAEVKPNALFSDHAVLQQGLPVPVWGTARDGEKITVTFAGQTVTTTAKDGTWKVTLNPLGANAEPQTMTIMGENTIEVKDILVGEVWICGGQSNMAFPLASATNGAAAVAAALDPQLRLLTVPRQGKETPQHELNASWSASTPTNVGGFTAVGYFFGRDLRKTRKVPVGLINSNVGGTPAEKWTSLAALEATPALTSVLVAQKKAVAGYPQALARYHQDEAKLLEKWRADCEKAKADNKHAPKKPAPPQNPATDGISSLYNAMIAPLQPFAIAGVIWYQGEANASRAGQYKTLFPTMIKDWRDVWGQGQFPFLFVQIAPYEGQPPEIREAQLVSWQRTPNTAMAVTMDVGEAHNIHPTQKEPVGARLALAARVLAYGEKIEYSGPVIDKLAIDGARAVLSFTHAAGGLMAKGGALKGFTMAGADKKFVPAQAVIEGDTVIVTSPEVAKPVAVRYGWANIPDVNLFNKADLPASPFRTDLE